MNKLLIVQHSETDGQHPDSPLTKSGVRQSQALASFLERSGYEVAHLISSPFLRAIETIKPFALHKGLPIKKDERLEERIISHEPLDDWEEVLWDSFRDPNFKMSGGESSKEARKRLTALIKDLEQIDKGDVLLVTHGNLMTLLLQIFNHEFGFHDWKRLSTPDVFLVQKQGGEYTVERVWED